MRVRPADIDEVFYVLMHADKRHLDEIANAGVTQRQFLDLAYGWLKREGADTLWLDGHPACVLGYDGRYTWFIATPAYYAGGVPVIRHARRYWAEQAEKRGEILTLVTSTHPDTERWFRLLGFEIVERTANSTLFRRRAISQG